MRDEGLHGSTAGLAPVCSWIRWADLGAYFFDGAIMGNGLLGAVMHRLDPTRFGGGDALVLVVNRADLAQPLPARVAEGPTHARFMLGRLLMRPRGRLLRIEAELDLASARGQAVLHTTRGTLTVAAWVSATRQVLVIEQVAQGDEALADPVFLPAQAGVVRSLGRVDYDESATYVPHPQADRSVRGEVTIHHQPLGRGQSFRVTWAKLRGPDARSAQHVFSIDASHPAVPAGASDAVLDVQRTIDEGVAPLWSEHTRWWADHYARACLELPGDPSAERFWWIQQYKIGCLMRADLQMLDLLGPWYYHTPWPGIWWNMNTQMMYHHLGTGGRPELGRPMIETLVRWAHQLEANVPQAWRGRGAMAIGRASSFNLDSPVTMLPGDADPTLEGREAGNLLWALHTAWWLAMHDSRPAETMPAILALLRGAVRFYEPLIESNGQNRLHLLETFSPEYRAAADCNYDLSLLRWAVRLLVRECPDDPDAATWAQLAEHLVAPPLDANACLAIGRGVPLDQGHRHFSHLLDIWPVESLEVRSSEGSILARRSIGDWLSRGRLMPWSHAAACAMYARLGDAQCAIGQLGKLLQGLTVNTLYREAGLCLETPFLGLSAMQSMMLRSGPGVIEIAPALPETWRVIRVRGLRAFGGVEVSIDSTGNRLCVELRATRHYEGELRSPGESRRVRIEAGERLCEVFYNECQR
jgi:hypothetical protein